MNDASLTRHALTHCPACGHEIDTAGTTDGSEQRAGPGDASLCVRCTAFLVFNHDMSLRRMSDEEFDALETPVRVELLEARIRLKALERHFPWA